MLFFVAHRLGDSRKSAREVGASRLFCFTAGFSGSPNGIRFQAGWRHSLPVHNPTDMEQDQIGVLFERHLAASIAGQLP
jgi:hypothetical protein